MPPELSARKTLAFATVAVALALLSLEGIARLALAPSTAPSFEEHRRLIRVIGLPALNDVLEFDPVLFWRLKPELRAFPVVGRVGHFPVDFRVTTHASLRSAPVTPSKPNVRVLALGDSCTFGLGVE